LYEIKKEKIILLELNVQFNLPVTKFIDFNTILARSPQNSFYR